MTQVRRPCRLAASLVAVVLGLAVARAGEAKVVDLHGALLAGGQMGNGSGGSTPDFFRTTRGPGFGAELGLRVTIVDLSFRFLQMVGSNGREGTLSMIPMLSFLLDIPLDGHFSRRQPRLVLRPGIGAGFGFGTPGPVRPPLSADQISGKGLMLVARCGLERMLGPFFGVGLEAETGYHYFFGGNGLINGSDHASGWQIAAFVTATAHFGW